MLLHLKQSQIKFNPKHHPRRYIHPKVLIVWMTCISEVLQRSLRHATLIPLRTSNNPSATPSSPSALPNNPFATPSNPCATRHNQNATRSPPCSWMTLTNSYVTSGPLLQLTPTLLPLHTTTTIITTNHMTGSHKVTTVTITNHTIGNHRHQYAMLQDLYNNNSNNNHPWRDLQ